MLAPLRRLSDSQRPLPAFGKDLQSITPRKLEIRSGKVLATPAPGQTADPATSEMADQLKSGTKQVSDQTTGLTKGTPAAGLHGKIKGTTESALSAIDGWAMFIDTKVRAIVDRIFPPDQREAFLAKLQAFMLANPKLSIFLGMNLALTGIPLGLFIVYSVSVFLSSLIIGLIVGILAAVVFTLIAVGIALGIVLPTVIFTTGTACFLFLWGLGAYFILQWANGSKSQNGSAPAPEGQAIGDKLNSLTGGRLSGFMDSARAQNGKKDGPELDGQPAKPNGSQPTAPATQKQT